ncbi:MAG: TIGR04283 family arsenosugar biosynthesis glycosyltransferase [Celeribacter sp.]|jgi:rSAM/selenodomain-associated transferase 2
MPAPISVIIPTWNAAAVLPDTLASLVEGLGAGLIRELIVSDGGSVDATCAIAREAGAEVVAGMPGRGAQIGAGLATARAPWRLVLHADTWLAPGWSGPVSDHLSHPDRAAHFRLAFRARGAAPRLVAGWANLRSRWAGLPYGDQGLLIHRDLLAARGGYPALPLMEDVAMARALRGAFSVLPVTAQTSAARYADEGWLRRGAGNLWLLARYMGGAPPERLAAAYRPRFASSDLRN